MNYLIFTYKNITYTLSRKPVFSAILLAVQLVSVIAILFSIGIVQNAYSKQQEITQWNRRFEIELRYDSPLETELVQAGYSADENGETEIAYEPQPIKMYDKCVAFSAFREKIDELCREIDYQYDYVGLNCLTDSASPKDGFRVVSVMYSPNATEKNEPSGNNLWVQYDMYPLEVGEAVEIGGKSYVVEKNDKGSNGAWYYGYMKMNESVLQNDFLVISFELMLDHVPTEAESTKITQTIRSLFDTNEITVPTVPDLMELQFQRTTIGVATAIMLLCALNAGSFFLYLLHSRRRNLTILRLCGCKTRQALAIYYAELFLQISIPFLAAWLIFDKWLRELACAEYAVFDTLYSSKLYLLVYFGYLAVSFVAMLPRIIPLLKSADIATNKGAE